MVTYVLSQEKKNTRGLAPSVDSLMYYSLNGVESFLDALKAMCPFYDVFRDCWDEWTTVFNFRMSLRSSQKPVTQF